MIVLWRRRSRSINMNKRCIVSVRTVCVIAVGMLLVFQLPSQASPWVTWRFFPWLMGSHRQSATTAGKDQPEGTTASVSIYKPTIFGGWTNPSFVLHGAWMLLSRRITSWLWREVPNNNRFLVDRLGPSPSNTAESPAMSPIKSQHQTTTTKQWSSSKIRHHHQAQPSQDYTNEVIDGGRVVRSRRRYPYMARLRAVFEVAERRNHVTEGVEVAIRRCSGTLVHSEWVLTAAHCVKMEGSVAKEATITLGDLNADDEEGTEVRRVVNSTAFVIPGYFQQQGARLFNDIALIKLTPPVTIFGASGILPTSWLPQGTTGLRAAAAMMRANVRPIQLAKHFAEDYVSDGSIVAEVVGWGRRSKTDGTNKLTATPVPIRHVAYCWFINGIRRWTSHGALSQLCYGGGSSWPSTWSGSCLDDGGAPIIKKGPNSPDQDVQIGIVSYSLIPDERSSTATTCNPQLPGVATRVSYFNEAFVLPWIDNDVGQDG